MDEEVQANIAATSRRAKRQAAKADKAMKRELSFKGFSPALVGLVRGALNAAVLGVLTYVTTQLSDTAGGAGLVGGVATVGIAVVRAVEGILDGKLLGAPRQKRLLGGAPVGPRG
jgi:hypothetical protein